MAAGTRFEHGASLDARHWSDSPAVPVVRDRAPGEVGAAQSLWLDAELAAERESECHGGATYLIANHVDKVIDLRTGAGHESRVSISSRW